MRLAVLNLTKRSQLNAIIYGALLGFVFATIISIFVLINQKIEFNNFIKFVASVEWAPGMHPGAKR